MIMLVFTHRMKRNQNNGTGKRRQRIFQNKPSGTGTLLTPVYKDGFSFRGGNLFFERDEKQSTGKLSGNISGARKAEFSRLI